MAEIAKIPRFASECAKNPRNVSTSTSASASASATGWSVFPTFEAKPVDLLDLKSNLIKRSFSQRPTKGTKEVFPAKILLQDGSLFRIVIGVGVGVGVGGRDEEKQKPKRKFLIENFPVYFLVKDVCSSVASRLSHRSRDINHVTHCPRWPNERWWTKSAPLMTMKMLQNISNDPISVRERFSAFNE